jgi:GTPase
VMRRELAAYNPALEGKPFAVVATKTDIKGMGARLEQLQAYCQARGLRFFAISAATREGLDTMVTFIGKQVDALKAACATRS